jgi:5-formyltetrahydrofolate cyclo-ligase
MTEKNTLRARIKFLLSRISPEDKMTANRRITEKVLGLPEIIRSNSICCYQSFPSEVDTRLLITLLRQGGKIVILPEDKSENADCFIVPGIGFDTKCNRLGRGGGFYDRLLKHLQVPKIGLAYEKQMVAQLNVKPYDVPMDMVITERNIYYAKTS